MNTAIISEVALALAEGHVRDVASMGGQAHPSDADECFGGCTLPHELRDAGIADWNDDSNIDMLRSMLRRTIGQLLDDDASEREEYTATLRAEQNAADDADRAYYEKDRDLAIDEQIRAEGGAVSAARTAIVLASRVAEVSP